MAGSCPFVGVPVLCWSVSDVGSRLMDVVIALHKRESSLQVIALEILFISVLFRVVTWLLSVLSKWWCLQHFPVLGGVNV